MVIKGIVTLQQIDRHNDEILIDGIEISNYEKNPIVLYEHGRGSPFAIGKCVLQKKADRIVAEIEIMDGDEEDEDYELIATIKSKVSKGILNGLSAGYKVLKDGVEFVFNEANELQKRVFNRVELLEISLVTIPANQSSLIYEVSKSGESGDKLIITKQFNKLKMAGDILEKTEGAVALCGENIDSSLATLSKLLEEKVVLAGELQSEVDVLKSALAAKDGEKDAAIALIQKELDEARATVEVTKANGDVLQRSIIGLQIDNELALNLAVMKTKSGGSLTASQIKSLVQQYKSLYTVFTNGDSLQSINVATKTVEAIPTSLHVQQWVSIYSPFFNAQKGLGLPNTTDTTSAAVAEADYNALVEKVKGEAVMNKLAINSKPYLQYALSKGIDRKDLATWALQQHGL